MLDVDPVELVVIERGQANVYPRGAESQLELCFRESVTCLRAVHVRGGAARPDAGEEQPRAERYEQERPDHVPVQVVEDAQVGEQEQDADDDEDAAPPDARVSVPHDLSARCGAG